MKTGAVNFVVDGMWGSSGKGKLSTFLADHFDVKLLSSSNFPNAGHSTIINGKKFISKAIPTALFLGGGSVGIISPGSGFDWTRFILEWEECGRPQIVVHELASIVTPGHAEQERHDGPAKIASTMQGSGAAMVDKIMRRAHTRLAREATADWPSFANTHFASTEQAEAFFHSVNIISGADFRAFLRTHLAKGDTILHEVSQGYTLSLDHGDWPYGTSRNCTTAAGLDQLGISPRLLGDVYLNFRTFPIRVGNVVDPTTGETTGFSGNFGSGVETTWEAVGQQAGMPQEEISALAERERTTVTKRIRRVSSFPWDMVYDIVQTTGATKLCLNFVQYLDWADNGVRGTSRDVLSQKTRDFIAKLEDTASLPVVFAGTGADHEDCVFNPSGI